MPNNILPENTAIMFHWFPKRLGDTIPNTPRFPYQDRPKEWAEREPQRPIYVIIHDAGLKEGQFEALEKNYEAIQSIKVMKFSEFSDLIIPEEEDITIFACGEELKLSRLLNERYKIEGHGQTLEIVEFISGLAILEEEGDIKRLLGTLPKRGEQHPSHQAIKLIGGLVGLPIEKIVSKLEDSINEKFNKEFLEVLKSDSDVADLIVTIKRISLQCCISQCPRDDQGALLIAALLIQLLIAALLIQIECLPETKKFIQDLNNLPKKARVMFFAEKTIVFDSKLDGARLIAFNALRKITGDLIYMDFDILPKKDGQCIGKIKMNKGILMSRHPCSDSVDVSIIGANNSSTQILAEMRDEMKRVFKTTIAKYHIQLGVPYVGMKQAVFYNILSDRTGVPKEKLQQQNQKRSLFAPTFWMLKGYRNELSDLLAPYIFPTDCVDITSDGTWGLDNLYGDKNDAVEERALTPTPVYQATTPTPQVSTPNPHATPNPQDTDLVTSFQKIDAHRLCGLVNKICLSG